MSDGLNNRWYIPVALVMALGTARAPAQVAPQLLPVRDQVAVYTDALRATAAMQEHYGLPGRLVLIPLTEIPVVDSAAPQRGWRWVPIDTAVSGALLRSGAVAGLCLPGRAARRCANDERGIGVRLSTFNAPWPDSSRVNVDVQLQGVQAEHDFGILVDRGRHDLWSFVRMDGHWRLSMPSQWPPL
jgi:hypothetical protein